MYKFFKDHISVFFIVFIVWAVFSALILVFINGLPLFNVNNIGAYGDSFNILTSLFTGLAFAGVIVSIVLQTQELKEAREEFEGQKNALISQGFDNKFFQLLALFNTIRFEYIEVKDDTSIFNILDKVTIRAIARSDNSLEKFIEEFKIVNYMEASFKYYFINMYQVLKYIDKHFNDKYKQDFNDKDAKFYTNIVRAQLSSQELIILFYYAYFISETHGDNFKKLVEKYEFFEHLGYYNLLTQENTNILNEILLKYDIVAFGKNKDIKEEIEKL